MKAKRNLTVTLESCGNTDLGQDSRRPLPGVPSWRRKRVTSLASASKACLKYIAEHSLGYGNWIGGDIYEGAAYVARVSYNGRLWLEDGKELTLDNGAFTSLENI